MRIFYCYFSLFLLSGLTMGSMESMFFTDFFGKMGNSIPTLFALPLIVLIQDYFKDIKGRIFWLLVVLSFASYLVLTVILID
jgi:hypothetical protein